MLIPGCNCIELLSCRIGKKDSTAQACPHAADDKNTTSDQNSAHNQASDAHAAETTRINMPDK